jgi:hypothetical protein
MNVPAPPMSGPFDTPPLGGYTPISMASSGRRRAGLLVLLVLAAGFAFAAAGAAAASGAHEMACCPADAADDRGCAWLGAGDCCPERPAGPAPASPNAAPPASTTAAASALVPPAFGPAATPPSACRAPAPHLSRSEVLRL